MSAPLRDLDSEKLRRLILGVPARLGVWRAGRGALHPLLYRSSLERLLDLARAMHEEDPRSYAAAVDRWRHATATLVDWYSRFAQPDERAPTGQDVVAGVRRAVDWRELEAIEAGLATGEITIEAASGWDVRLANRRDHAIEVLDILLEQVTAPVPTGAAPDAEAAIEWFRSRAGRADLVLSVPAWVEDSLYERALHGLVARGLTLPEDTDLGGLTLRDARSCYALLLASAQIAELCTTVLQCEGTAVWRTTGAVLEARLAHRCSHNAAQAFIRLATYARGRTASSAPLIPDGTDFRVPQALLSDVGFERTLLRAATADPGRVGRLGNLLGRRASRWAERLRTIPGTQVAEQLKVADQAGRVIGDLDVVAFDPAERVALVVEAKWPVDAHTLRESAKVDALFDSGRRQLAGLREAIRSGAVVRWPKGWDVSDDLNITWWVGSAQQLDSRAGVGRQEIASTSLRLVEQLLPATSLSDLVTRHSNFPMPRLGIEYDLVESTVRAGKYRITYPALLILGDPPIPPAERRTDAGWT